MYSLGIPKSRLFEEAGRVFRFDSKDQFMSIQKLYKDSFALVVDLRTIYHSFTCGNGKKLVNTQSGLLLEIKKKAITGNVMCKIFVFSDGLVNIVNRDLMFIQY